MNEFDSVAPFYDRLASLIFGKAMRQAQTTYLSEIRQGANVLVLGGGTGWLLPELCAINPACKVWYIEASTKMIGRAKKNVVNSGQEIVFIHSTEDSIPADIKFDAVITNFYLDLFPQDLCAGTIRKIRPSLGANRIWLVCDFVDTTWWHSAMLGVMYRFFRLMCRVEASSLPDWESLLVKHGLREHKSKKFFGRFIKSAVFESNDQG